MKVLTELQ